VPGLKGFAFEKIYQDDVINAVKEYFSVEKLDKKHYSMFFSKKLYDMSDDEFPETKAMFAPISAWLDSQFGPPISKRVD